MDIFLTSDKDHFKIEGDRVSFELGDKIPSEINKSAIGGNGANVSVGLTRLEIPTTFYTYLGNDFFSREIEQGLASHGVELSVERHIDSSPPLHIILDFAEDRVIFSNYSKTDHGFSLGNETNFDYIFLTSIPETWEGAYRSILEFSKMRKIPLVFSPGTRQIEDKNALTLEVVKASSIYFSNLEEAAKILEKETNSSSVDSIKEILSGIGELGPKIVSITDGGNGAYAFDENKNFYKIPPSPAMGNEKTGAGDAYSSGFMSAIVTGQDIQTAMLWGSLNAAGVMREIGAQNGLLNKKELDSFIKEHNNLKAEKI